MSILDKITASASSGVMSGDKNSTIIGENCVIEGDVTFEKTIEIHGKIVGTVKIAENCTSAVLVIKKSGIVEGDVYGSDVQIEGEVIGNVSGKKKIAIESSAFVSGNVYYDILDMQGGATVNGNLIRNKGKEPQKLENKTPVPLEGVDSADSNKKLL
jgi:cytoskeletal protein CcmA (bactofilin family)